MQEFVKNVIKVFEMLGYDVSEWTSVDTNGNVMYGIIFNEDNGNPTYILNQFYKKNTVEETVDLITDLYERGYPVLNV